MTKACVFVLLFGVSTGARADDATADPVLKVRQVSLCGKTAADYAGLPMKNFYKAPYPTTWEEARERHEKWCEKRYGSDLCATLVQELHRGLGIGGPYAPDHPFCMELEGLVLLDDAHKVESKIHDLALFETATEGRGISASSAGFLKQKDRRHSNSILCTALYDLGHLPLDTYVGDMAFGEWFRSWTLGLLTYEGYIATMSPVAARIAQGDKLALALAKPVVTAGAEALAWIMGAGAAPPAASGSVHVLALLMLALCIPVWALVGMAVTYFPVFALFAPVLGLLMLALCLPVALAAEAPACALLLLALGGRAAPELRRPRALQSTPTKTGKN